MRRLEIGSTEKNATNSCLSNGEVMSSYVWVSILTILKAICIERVVVGEGVCVVQELASTHNSCLLCTKFAFWGHRVRNGFGIVSYHSDTSFHLLIALPQVEGEAVQLDTICMDRTASWDYLCLRLGLRLGILGATLHRGLRGDVEQVRLFGRSMWIETHAFISCVHSRECNWSGLVVLAWLVSLHALLPM